MKLFSIILIMSALLLWNVLAEEIDENKVKEEEKLRVIPSKHVPA